MAMYLSIAAVFAVLLIGGMILLRFVTKRCKKGKRNIHGYRPYFKQASTSSILNYMASNASTTLL